MNKVKIIRANTSDELEEKINDFLSTWVATVQDISYTQITTSTTAYILYVA